MNENCEYEYNAPQFAENFDEIIKSEVDESFFGGIKSREENKRNNMESYSDIQNDELSKSRGEENNSTCSLLKHNCIVIKESVPFKAKSATVLHKKPFEIKRPVRHPLKPLDIKLNTEIRSKEREEYVQKVHEWRREADNYNLKLLMKIKKEEEEEIARLRKEAVHKPLPLPSYISRSKRRRSKSCS